MKNNKRNQSFIKAVILCRYLNVNIPLGMLLKILREKRQFCLYSVKQLYGPNYLEKSLECTTFLAPLPIHTADSQMFSFSSLGRNKPHFSVYLGAAKWA